MKLKVDENYKEARGCDLCRKRCFFSGLTLLALGRKNRASIAGGAASLGRIPGQQQGSQHIDCTTSCFVIAVIQSYRKSCLF